MPVALFLAALLNGDPRLLWPLEFDDGLAASFGELRGDRLHTGVDLRTRGETGFPVHAAASGHAVRIKEEWRGYGLALYLEHEGGLVTVYAHLDHLAPALEAKLDAARKARGSGFAGDVELTPPVAVAAGEVVAFSGETGAGLPHLHFETRQGMERPIDPFAAGLAPPADTYPPVAEELVIEPASDRSTVNGEPAALTLALGGSRGRYRAAERPIVAGPFNLLLRAYDRAGAENWAGVPGILARLDGAEVFRLQFDAIPFGANQTAGAVLDLARSHLSPSWYTYRLTRLPGAALPFTRGREGPLDLAPGRHRLEVDLHDMVSTLAPRTTVAVELVAEAPGEAAAQPAQAHGLAPLVPGAARKLTFGPLTLALGGGELYAAVAIAGETLPVPALPDGLLALSPAVALIPDGHPFRTPITVSFSAAATGPKAGVYRFDSYDRSWGLEDMGTSAAVRHLATYALIEDRAAPTITRVTPSAGSEVEPGPLTVEVSVTDLGSGLPQAGIAMTADHRALAVLYDPDRERARAAFDAAPGVHSLAVRATDRAGNTAERTVRFRARTRGAP